MPEIHSLSGNEVIAHAAVAAGCRFFAGYPITPSSEIAAVMSHELPKVGGVFLQMEDEIAAMGAVIGGSLAGMKALTATSGPGFSLKQENIGFAAMAEVPCVIVNVMRGGPSTGLPTLPSQADVMQARWGTHGDHPVIALYPADLTEMYHETIRAFNLAEKYRTPVILLSDEMLGHMSERVEIPDAASLSIIERKKPNVPASEYLPYALEDGPVPPMANFFEGYRYHVTGLTHDETGFPTEDEGMAETQHRRLMDKIASSIDDIVSWEEDGLEDAEIILLAYGASARSARAALPVLRSEGLRAGLLRPITIWPFPEQVLLSGIHEKAHIFVVELNLGQITLEVERAVGKERVTGVHKVSGRPISPDEIISAVHTWQERTATSLPGQNGRTTAGGR